MVRFSATGSFPPFQWRVRSLAVVSREIKGRGRRSTAETLQLLINCFQNRPCTGWIRLDETTANKMAALTDSVCSLSSWHLRRKGNWMWNDTTVRERKVERNTAYTTRKIGRATKKERQLLVHNAGGSENRAIPPGMSGPTLKFFVPAALPSVDTSGQVEFNRI